jgi:DNA (cytosine-5)-methyltransferase 1
MRVLNLYAGLGGNRKLWQNIEVTAIENNPTIAKFYKDHFPNDIVLIEDAHDFLLHHYSEYDFIWSSINCPSHSRARFWASGNGHYKPVYPDMKLYEEILFLKHYYKGLWTVENVKPFYKILIEPTINIERHLFWSNFNITPLELQKNRIFDGSISVWQNETGFNLQGYTFDIRKDKILRNCVNPELGLHILNCALYKEDVIQKTIFD